MLNTIKKMMGICNNSFDDTIELYINSAKQDLSALGIVVDASKPIIKTAIINYVLSQLDIDNSDMFTNSYNLQKDQLRHYKEYSK